VRVEVEHRLDGTGALLDALEVHVDSWMVPIDGVPHLAARAHAERKIRGAAVRTNVRRALVPGGPAARNLERIRTDLDVSSVFGGALDERSPPHPTGMIEPLRVVLLRPTRGYCL